MSSDQQRVNASVLAEETTRIIDRTWHSSRPKPRNKEMGMEREEGLRQKRLREIREMMASDQNVADTAYRILGENQ